MPELLFGTATDGANFITVLLLAARYKNPFPLLHANYSLYFNTVQASLSQSKASSSHSLALSPFVCVTNCHFSLLHYYMLQTVCPHRAHSHV